MAGYSKMKMDEWLFWAERIAFLSMALTWSLLDAQTTPALILTPDKYFTSFWLCTNILYFLAHLKSLFAGTLLPGESGIDEHFFEKNPGFWLERFALLIWYLGSTSPYPIIMQFTMKFCFGVIFPSLNVYFALRGYSREFHQKVSPDGVSFWAKVKSTDVEEQELLFWFERLSLVALTVSWITFCNTEMWIVMWVFTNTFYYIIDSWRSIQGDQQNHHEYSTMMLRIKRYPGFWLERLVLLPFVVFYLLHSPMVLNVYFTVILPLSHVYFAWFGYSKEFRLHDQPLHNLSKESVKADGEMRKTETLPQQHQNMAPNRATSSVKEEEVRPDDHNPCKESGNETAKTVTLPQQHQNMTPTPCSVADDYFVAPDTIKKCSDAIEKIHLQIVNAVEKCNTESERLLADQEKRIIAAIRNEIMEENHRKEDVKMLAAVEKNELQKLIEKYKEENRILEEKNSELAVKFAVATKSSQLYRDLLHDPEFLMY